MSEISESNQDLSKAEEPVASDTHEPPPIETENAGTVGGNSESQVALGSGNPVSLPDGVSAQPADTDKVESETDVPDDVEDLKVVDEIGNDEDGEENVGAEEGSAPEGEQICNATASGDGLKAAVDVRGALDAVRSLVDFLDVMQKSGLPESVVKKAAENKQSQEIARASTNSASGTERSGPSSKSVKTAPKKEAVVDGPGVKAEASVEGHEDADAPPPIRLTGKRHPDFLIPRAGKGFWDFQRTALLINRALDAGVEGVVRSEPYAVFPAGDSRRADERTMQAGASRGGFRGRGSRGRDRGGPRGRGLGSPRGRGIGSAASGGMVSPRGPRSLGHGSPGERLVSCRGSIECPKAAKYALNWLRTVPHTEAKRLGLRGPFVPKKPPSGSPFDLKRIELPSWCSLSYGKHEEPGGPGLSLGYPEDHGWPPEAVVEWKKRPASLKGLEQIGAQLERLSNIYSVALDTFLTNLTKVVEAHPEVAEDFSSLRPQIQDLRDLDVLLANRALVNFDLVAKTSRKIVLDSMPIDSDTFKRYWHVRPTRDLFPNVHSIEGFRKALPDFEVMEKRRRGEEEKRREEEERRRLEIEEEIRWREQEMRRLREEEEKGRLREEQDSVRLADERCRRVDGWRYDESRKRARGFEDGKGNKRLCIGSPSRRDYEELRREPRHRDERYEHEAQLPYHGEPGPKREDRDHYGHDQRTGRSGHSSAESHGYPGGSGSSRYYAQNPVAGPGPSAVAPHSPNSKRTLLMSEVERLLGVVSTSILSSSGPGRGGRPDKSAHSGA